MLVKTKQTIETLVSSTYSSYTGYGTPVSKWTATLTKYGKIRFECTGAFMQAGGFYGIVQFKVGDETIYNEQLTNTSASTLPFISDNAYKSGQVFSLWIGSQSQNNSYYYTVSQPKIYQIEYNMEKLMLDFNPSKIVLIGELLTGVIYGNNEDGEYIGGIMIKEESTATTGNITLGNAKGYIRVLFNGEYIKIPYYGD